MKNLLALIASVGLTAAALSPAPAASTVYALTDKNHLLTFQSDEPNPAVKPANYDQTITGLPMDVDLVGLALRTDAEVKANAVGLKALWALGVDGNGVYRLYEISPSAVATEVSGALTVFNAATVSDDGWGFAYNPGSDRFVAVGVNFNFEINPNASPITAVRRPDVATPDTQFPAFSGAAFTNVPFGQNSRFYIADTGAHRLATSANIKAGGIINFAGPMGYGMGLNNSQPNGLAVLPDNKTGLFAYSGGELYTLNLSTGIASLVGAFPMGTEIRGLAIKPPAPVTVKITKPKSTRTRSASIVLKGSATCKDGIKAVQYRVGSGKFVNVKGNLTKWKFTAKLKVGANSISVRAIGKNDATSRTQKIKITRLK